MTKSADEPMLAPSDLLAVYEALDKVQAIIEFDLDGTVISANQNFLDTFGYELEEIAGEHHRIFCEPGYAASPELLVFRRRGVSGIRGVLEEASERPVRHRRSPALEGQERGR